jgi:hypothetical protein
MAIKGEVIVTNIAKTDLADVIHFGDCDTWYKVKISFVSFDADSEKEKKQASNVLVNAPDLIESIKRANDNFKDSVSSYEILAAAISPIVDIYAYDDSAPELPKPIGEFIENGLGNSSVYSAPSLDEEEDFDEHENNDAEIVDEFSDEDNQE